MAERAAASLLGSLAKLSARSRKSSHSNVSDKQNAYDEWRSSLTQSLDPPLVVEFIQASKSLLRFQRCLDVHNELGVVLRPFRIMEHVQSHRILTEEPADVAANFQE